MECSVIKELRPTDITDVTNKTALEIFPQTDAGLQGFVCPKSRREVPFAFCITDCKNHCKPLPVLIALYRQMHHRDDYNTFHVTETLNPPQQVHLSRTKPYYVDADSLLDMNVGTAWHNMLDEQFPDIQQLGLEDDYIMEKTMKINRDGSLPRSELIRLGLDFVIPTLDPLGVIGP